MSSSGGRGGKGLKEQNEKPVYHIELVRGGGLAIDEIDFGERVIIARRRTGEKFFIPYSSIVFVHERSFP